MRTIQNGTSYPKALKSAALKAAKLAVKPRTARSVAAVAADFNVAPSTLSTWKRVAKLNKAQPVGLARHQAAAAAIKVFNTPTAVAADGTPCDAAKATHIQFRGKTYKV